MCVRERNGKVRGVCIREEWEGEGCVYVRGMGR